MTTTNPAVNKIEVVSQEIDKLQVNVENCDLKKTIQNIGSEENAQLQRFKQDTDLKRKLAYFVICFTSIWSLIIVLIIVFKNNLSDVVLIALITETLCLVLGLPLIVITHFFPNENKNNK